MQKYLTLTELQSMVKTTLNEVFALPLWVSAEIAELKVNYSGHCYMELVEKGGENGVPLSQARAVIWRTAYSKVAGYFEAETGQRLAAGIRILARVTVTYHELYGFSLNISDIDPSFTLGDMQRQRQDYHRATAERRCLGYEPGDRFAARCTANRYHFKPSGSRLSGFSQ